MGGTIYVATTYYHALIACLKQLCCSEDADIMLTAYIPGGQALSQRIGDSELFSHTWYAGEAEEYSPTSFLDYWLFHHRKNSKKLRQYLPVDLRQYSDIRIFHDDTWVAHYLKDLRIPYHLLEDALDSFKYISHSNFAYMMPRGFRTAVKKLLRIGYVFCGADSCTLSVEVNDAQGIEIAHAARGKLRVIPRQPLFDRLTESETQLLRRIFLKDIPPFVPENSVLLLTQPLYEDGTVSSPQRQAEIYRSLVQSHIADGDTLLVKPHPRDSTDYAPIFPEAVLLDREMPAEIMLLGRDCVLKKVLTINSTSARRIPAEDYIFTENDFILQEETP